MSVTGSKKILSIAVTQCVRGEPSWACYRWNKRSGKHHI